MCVRGNHTHIHVQTAEQTGKKKKKRESHLADTVTASRSLQRSAGIDFRHCLDRRKSPGKKTVPAARMDSMIPGDPSKRQKGL